MFLKTDFKFKKFELDTIDDGVFSPDFDDSDWRVVRIPHDWELKAIFLPIMMLQLTKLSKTV